VIISPSGGYIDPSIRLEFACTNNQVENKSLLHGLEFLRDLGAKDVDVFGYSNLIVQQIRGDSQFLHGVFNSYGDRCLDIIMLFDTFSIKHIPRGENSQANQLAPQASGYIVSQGVFWVASVSLVANRYALRRKGKPVLENSDRIQDEEKLIPDNTNWLLGKTKPGSGKAKPKSGKTESGRGCEIGLREEAKPTSVERFKEESVTKKDKVEKDGSPVDDGTMKPIMEGDSVKGGDMIWTDWRLPLLKCIRDPEKTTNYMIKHQALKYTLLDDDLYRRTIDGMSLKCLDEEQAKVTVRKAHDGICGAHRSAHKMNWLLRRAEFYWLTMMGDSIKYQKGCEACQRIKNIQLASASVMNSTVKSWPF
jgi:hypothetical protein